MASTKVFVAAALRTWALLFALTGATAAWAQTAAALPAGVTRASSVEGVTEYRLANGLQLLLVPDESKPSTTVNLTYRVGSRHENYGETGMAHLLEHLIFKGTPTTPNAATELSKRGLRYNGTTSYDRTNYFASFTASDDTLRWYLGWQADAMVNSFIARRDLDSEMTVVRNEMESGENSPFRILMQRTLATMYEWHNYGKDTIGARSDVENVDIARLQAFYRQYYQPDNATLIVAGRFDPAQVLAWTAQAFAAIPLPQRVIAPTYTLDPTQDGERSVTVRRVGGSPLLVAAYHTPAGAQADFAAAELMSWALGDPPSGRLHKRLVEQHLAASTFGTAFARAEPGALLFGVTLAPGQDIERARAALLSTLDAVAKQPLTAADVERARTQWLNNWEQGFTDPEVIGIQLGEAVALGDWRLHFLRRDQVRKVTLGDVQRVARDWLRPDNRTVGLYRPVAAPERAPAAGKADVAALLDNYKGQADVAQAEAFEATPAKLDERLQKSQLASGMRVALLPKGTRGQAVQVRLRLHYGDERSLFGQEAVAALVGASLDKGAAGLTRQQLSDRFDALRMAVGFNADDQTLSVSLNTVRQHLPAAIALLGRVLRTPVFPAAGLEEARRQWLAGLEEQRKDPGALVAQALSRHGNPYPRGDLRNVPSFDELEQDLKAVTAAQLRTFHARFYSAATAEFAAVGDFDVAAVQRALSAAFGDWRQPAAGRPYVRVANPLVVVAPKRFDLKTPDKPNAHLQAQLALPLNDLHPDYPALTLANYIFGGGSNSRLSKRIREAEGLSYDVRSTVEWSNIDPNSPWVVTAIFAPQNQPRVEAAWRAELTRSLQDGFTAVELDEARTSLLSLRRLSRAQDANLAAAAASNLRLQRSFMLSQQTDDKLAQATLEEVNAVWRKYIAPARLVEGWAGDFKP